MRQVDWLLKLDPRPAQIEALNRSYLGIAYRDALTDDAVPCAVPGAGGFPRRGWGHFLEQRIGKTPTFLNEFMLFRRDYDFKWAIVLSPNAYKKEWVAEAEKFGVDCAAMAFDSRDRAALQKFITANRENGGLISINYEALGSADTLSGLVEVLGPKTIIVADESVWIKSPNSQMSKNARNVSKLCGAARVMSGKPITQGAHDLWAQLRFIGELDGWNPYAFKHAFCRMGGFQGKQVLKGEDNIRNPERLRAIRVACSWAARKVDWMKTFHNDYPPPVKITLLPDQLRIYKAMQTDFMVQLSGGTTIGADQIITKLIKMQQIASGFVIDEGGTIHDLMPPAKNPKLVELKRMLDDDIIIDDAGGKVIISCLYLRSIELIEEFLKDYNPAVIRGAEWHRTSGRDIATEKRRFNEDPSCKILVGQVAALRYGHTLMGSQDFPCLNLIMYENNYSLNDRSQVEERSRGAGQVAPITIWDFVATREDLLVVKALQLKEDVAASIMGYARSTGVLPK